MGQGCSADQPNGGHVERTMETKSPVFIGQMASSYGGGGNSAPQGHCPGAPSTLPTPPCGGRTNNCEAKGEAQRLADKPESVTCNVTEYELTCKWEPRIVPKTCTVMVPQYKAVCAGQKKIQATVQRTYQVDTRFDANNDGVINQAEFEAARAGGGLTAMGGANIVGGGAAGGGGGAAAFGGQSGAASFGAAGGGASYGGGAMNIGGAQMGAAMGGVQMGGAQMGGGGGYGGGAMGGGGMGGAMGGGGQMGGHNMGMGGGYGN